MVSNRTRALDAAVVLLGTEGVRSLTHTRVDERAGLPKGSTSNYFRTRRALLEGVAARIAELELPQAGAAFEPPASVDAFVEGLSALLEYLSTTTGTRTAARFALFVEASHDAGMRVLLSQVRAEMEASAVVALAALGARDPRIAAAAVAACFEGLLLHRIARHDMIDPRPILGLVIGSAVKG